MCFQSFTNCPRRFATRAICETLKTRVKLNLNFTRPHAITYTNPSTVFLFSPAAFLWTPFAQSPKTSCLVCKLGCAGFQGILTSILPSSYTLVDSRTCRMNAHSCSSFSEHVQSVSSRFDSKLILENQFLYVLLCGYFIYNFYGKNSRCSFIFKMTKD